jgi:hypothetical protein
MTSPFSCLAQRACSRRARPLQASTDSPSQVQAFYLWTGWRRGSCGVRQLRQRPAASSRLSRAGVMGPLRLEDGGRENVLVFDNITVLICGLDAGGGGLSCGGRAVVESRGKRTIVR